MAEREANISSFRSKGLRSLFQAIVSLACLAGVVAFVDLETLLQRFSGLNFLWLTGAFLITVPQYLLSAARWRLTAGRLGIKLSFRAAVAEYYLAGLGNQLLPGGVVGDAARAVRHGRRLAVQGSERNYGPAIRAVIYERTVGQIALLFLLLPGLVAWPWLYDDSAPITAFGSAAALVSIVLIVAIAVLVLGTFVSRPAGRAVWTILSEARAALLRFDVFATLVFYSFVILGTYLLCFYAAGRAIGLELTAVQILTLVPAILFAMTVPISIGGWGIREATAAGIWGLAGFVAAEGVAISILYGVINLLAALPGVAVVAMGLGKGQFGDKR